MESLQFSLNPKISGKTGKVLQILSLAILICLGADKADATKCGCNPLDKDNLYCTMFQSYPFLFESFQKFFSASYKLPTDTFTLNCSNLGQIDSPKVTKSYNEYISSICGCSEKKGFIFFIEDWQNIGRQLGLTNEQMLDVFEQYLQNNYIPLQNILFLEDLKNFYGSKFDKKISEFMMMLDKNPNVNSNHLQLLFGDFIENYRNSQGALQNKITIYSFSIAIFLCIVLFLKSNKEFRRMNAELNRYAHNNLSVKKPGDTVEGNNFGKTLEGQSDYIVSVDHTTDGTNDSGGKKGKVTPLVHPQAKGKTIPPLEEVIEELTVEFKEGEGGR